jgi:hypothetical protein
MAEQDGDETEFDKLADQILSEMGLGPDCPRTSLTYEAGAELGSRLLTAVLSAPSLATAFARDILQIYREMFPPAPDVDSVEAQAYFWGPLVAKWLTGRGLTVPQIARLAGVSSDHVYRLMRGGLRILFIEAEPPARTGVNRRYSGIDGRETYLLPDPTGLTEREWPGEGEEIRPFIQGLMTGLQAWLGDPDNKARLEPVFTAALASALTDPSLGSIFDGAIVAFQRVSLDLRDRVFTMQAERERATNFANTLAAVAAQKQLVFDTLEQAAHSLAVGRGVMGQEI